MSAPACTAVTCVNRGTLARGTLSLALAFDRLSWATRKGLRTFSSESEAFGASRGPKSALTRGEARSLRVRKGRSKTRFPPSPWVAWARKRRRECNGPNKVQRHTEGGRMLGKRSQEHPLSNPLRYRRCASTLLRRIASGLEEANKKPTGKTVFARLFSARRGAGMRSVRGRSET